MLATTCGSLYQCFIEWQSSLNNAFWVIIWCDSLFLISVHSHILYLGSIENLLIQLSNCIIFADLTFSRHEQLMNNLQERITNLSSEEILTRLRDHIAQQTPVIRNAFMKYDRNNKGKISKKDFKTVSSSILRKLNNCSFIRITVHLKSLNFVSSFVFW